MALNPIQPNIENKNSVTPYREAKGSIKTDDLIKPLPAEGHLVHDTVLTVPKFWLKDIAYDVKSVRDGFRGEATDHQLGRINDVGLKLGGIGIAAYLASKTTNPMARTMEYVGLGTFLAAMSLYPKIAINAPSRLVHGFDIGKEYIDDQGRKKSVFQDSNYIPFDMYKGDFEGEDLDIIGDRMGIPRDIKNRHDLIKEQMRKIATQNNTLWMLTAGFATPVMTALVCCGLEQLIAPAVEKVRNNNYNKKITNTLKLTENMSLDLSEIKKNTLSEQVSKIISNYEGKELPKAEFDNIVKLLTQEMNSSNLAQSIKEDLTKIFKAESNGYSLNRENFAKELIETIKNTIPNNGNAETLKSVFVPTEAEIEAILSKLDINSGEISPDKLKLFKGELKNLYAPKIAASKGSSKAFLKAHQNNVILENLAKSIEKTPATFVSKDAINDVIDFAKVLGEFKSNEKALDKCQNFKFEFTPETVLARSYGKFEKTMFEVLDIKYDELKQMKKSSEITKEILNKKLTALAQNEAKYSKAIEKLSAVLAEMEVNMNGKAVDESFIKDLITATENNYNNTAKRIQAIGDGKFAQTLDQLVKEDISTLSNNLKTKEDLFNFLDGTLKPENKENGWTLKYAQEHSAGVGSAKNEQISRIVERYQGAKSTFNRVIHTMDYYRRGLPNSGYAREIAEKGRETLLAATSSNHTLKLNTVNNPELYKDVMKNVYNGELDEATKTAMSKSTNANTGNMLERFQKYIERFRDVIGNNDIDFQKPEHILGVDAKDNKIINKYTQDSLRRKSKFDLIGQNVVDTFRKGAERRFNTQKWLRAASAIGASVLGVTLLAQFSFGKIKNPHNIKKQVSDDTNS